MVNFELWTKVWALHSNGKRSNANSHPQEFYFLQITRKFFQIKSSPLLKYETEQVLLFYRAEKMLENFRGISHSHEYVMLSRQ